MAKVVNSKQKEVIQNKNFIYNPKNSNILESDNYFSEKIKTLYTTSNSDDELNKLFNDKKIGEPHPFDYNILEELSKRFAIISAVIDKICDFALGDGYNISSDDEKIKETLDEWRRKTKVDFFIRPWFNEGLLKGTSFLEFAEFSLKNTDDIIRNPSANTMFVRRDETGEIEGYTQHIDKSMSSTGKEETIIIDDTESIVQLNINNISNNSYGLGIVFATLPIVESFLSAQKSMHKLLKRKANNPLHVKIGDISTQDYPEQADINSVGKTLQFMNDSTEYVTGPNVEMKVLDFGTVSDKFIGVVDNDLKLLSYAFQVPEIILGADRGFVGSSEVQEKAFERNIKAYQEQIGFVMKNRIFDRVLLNAGITDLDYNIIWNSKTIKEKNEEIKLITELLKANVQLSFGVRTQLEKQLALIFDFDEEEIKKENDEMGKQLEKPKDEPNEDNEDNKDLENIKEDINGDVKRIYEKHICENNINENIKVSEFLNDVDIQKNQDNILNVLKNDKFSDIKAHNTRELKRGYLNENEINKFRNILRVGIENDMSLAEINILAKGNVSMPDLKKYNKIILKKDIRLKTTINTELARILNKGLKKSYQENKIHAVKWDATLDRKTCPICENLDGQIFEITSMNSGSMPPIHPRCRCSINPIKTTENIKKILNTNSAPQELESELIKNGIDENRAEKIVEKYNKLTDNGALHEE